MGSNLITDWNARARERTSSYVRNRRMRNRTWKSNWNRNMFYVYGLLGDLFALEKDRGVVARGSDDSTYGGNDDDNNTRKTITTEITSHIPPDFNNTLVSALPVIARTSCSPPPANILLRLRSGGCCGRRCCGHQGRSPLALLQTILFSILLTGAFDTARPRHARDDDGT